MKITRTDSKKTTKYQWTVRILSAMVIVLLVVVAAVPGALHLMYRADAQVALGNAKTVRMALQTAAMEAYAWDRAFGDQTTDCGLTEGARTQVYLLSKAPGDFQVLQLTEDGYGVSRFQYREGEFVVYYQAEPLSYQVYHETEYIRTQFPGEGATP